MTRMLIWALVVGCGGTDPATDSTDDTGALPTGETPTVAAAGLFPSCAAVYDKAQCACIEAEAVRRIEPALRATLEAIAKMDEVTADGSAKALSDDELSAYASFLDAIPEACDLPDEGATP